MRDSKIEIIVVDGGSTDETRSIAASLGATVVEAPRGRANQMNAGAAKACGDVLLFLHADTILPADYIDVIRDILARPGVAAGAFRFQTDLDLPSMRTVTMFAGIRAKTFQLPYGDQGFFLRKEVFRRACGFPPMPLMEDYEFVRRVRQFGRVGIADSPAITSGDRWRRLGVWRTTLRNAVIVGLYHLGVSPARLHQLYRRDSKRAVSSRS